MSWPTLKTPTQAPSMGSPPESSTLMVTVEVSV